MERRAYLKEIVGMVWSNRESLNKIQSDPQVLKRIIYPDASPAWTYRDKESIE